MITDLFVRQGKVVRESGRPVLSTNIIAFKRIIAIQTFVAPPRLKTKRNIPITLNNVAEHIELGFVSHNRRNVFIKP